MSVVVINIQNLLTGHITNSQDKFIYKFCTFANINYGQSEAKHFMGGLGLNLTIYLICLY